MSRVILQNWCLYNVVSHTIYIISMFPISHVASVETDKAVEDEKAIPENEKT